MDVSKLAEFRRHAALYAKGHYVTYYNPIDDLFTIGTKTGCILNALTGWEEILNELINMAGFGIIVMGKEKHDYKPLSSNPAVQLQAFVTFLHKNTAEVVQNYGLTRMRTDQMDNMDLSREQRKLIEISLVQALLVTIAKVRPEDDELGDPDPQILPLRDPKKGAKKREKNTTA